MVHKKSEYTLQFRTLAGDLRKHIWEENVKFRESCRSANQATHYWSYQLTDERCECEDDEEFSSCRPADGGSSSKQSAQVQLAIPAKASIVTERNVGNNVEQAVAPPSTNNGSRKEIVPKSSPFEYPTEVCNDLKDKSRTEKHQAEPVVPHRSENVAKILARKDGPSADVLQVKNSSTKRNDFTVKDAHILNTDAIPNAREAAVQTPDWEIPCCRSQDEKGKDTVSGKTSQRSGNLALRNSPSQLSQPVLSKTTRRHHAEDHKAPFAMFGWNSSGNTLADKKTHNVYAPKKEVYPEALLILKKRREQVEKFLADERKKRQQKRSNTSLTQQAEINHSSIWMSEYKDKFCRHDFKYEPSSFPCRKPPAAWRYS